MTQIQLAKALQVESITVSRWERGVTTPSVPRLRCIAEVTETTVSDLVRDPNLVPADALELAAIRAELAEMRALVDRMLLALDQAAWADRAQGSS